MGLKCVSRSSCIRFLKRLFLSLIFLSFTAVVLYSNFGWVLMEYQVYKPCNLEKINYRDKSLGDFFLESPLAACDDWNTMVSFDSRGLQKDDDVIKSYGFLSEEVDCEYSLIPRKDKGEVLRFKFKPLSSTISADFCFVRCFHNKTNIVYQGIHYRVGRLTKGGIFQDEGQDRPSILIILLDSVSRLVAERTLPNTMKYLRDRLHVYEMKGYTKIGDNSQPNFVALMTGKFQYETVMRPSMDYPWLFRQIINKGYMTCYADDWDPALPGYFFKLPEYDHYMIHSSFYHASLMENATSFVKDSKGNTRRFHQIVAVMTHPFQKVIAPVTHFPISRQRASKRRKSQHYMVDHINEMLSNYKNECMELTLININYAKIQYVPREHKVFQESVRYVVTVQTAPGDGIFRATAERYNSSTINILGDVNRLNAYGAQSNCIEDRILKLYCYWYTLALF
ncbi:hypothetical protein FSP39_022187 [Pinctada imbricata]|uniref:Uncharacterized protein n=1 Tax=Pinctada imbricata TaxID=66713 RepID=A0AA88YLM1_PINIB|nr:hypothetical protein FSP39_022187 [Pinctada imbricata]